ncbi:hypothetical protein CDAR_62961 [Caerostris darwini]|uniref:Uncharacterized protein n=1 Tax=Caerostris darwini TaxID=1538125 RepID=A0AAV4UFA5_9ARAC|nr:hypothetical protein CDAR_62961 [Caerostris darwini]
MRKRIIIYKTITRSNTAAYNVTVESRTIPDSPISDSRHRIPSVQNVHFGEISQQNPSPYHDASTSECMVFGDVLELIASAFFFPL